MYKKICLCTFHYPCIHKHFCMSANCCKFFKWKLCLLAEMKEWQVNIRTFVREKWVMKFAKNGNTIFQNQFFLVWKILLHFSNIDFSIHYNDFFSKSDFSIHCRKRCDLLNILRNPITKFVLDFMLQLIHIAYAIFSLFINIVAPRLNEVFSIM